MTTDNTSGSGGSVLDVEIDALQGGSANLSQYAGKAVLVVNVASKCGLTPQYAGLERLQERFAPMGFTVLGVPCNQFLGQEPGSAEEIAEFCSPATGPVSRSGSPDSAPSPTSSVDDCPGGAPRCTGSSWSRRWTCRRRW
ncbi:glutathione peroxidase [Streptomyces sp. NPDC057062]|uniref:glutathione peroxidase n=1 Tax=Streptomyces sp. NPDC057062 TaxID=3346011 RepID=UPI0036328200